MGYINYSGGAKGADIAWEIIGDEFGVKTISMSFDGQDILEVMQQLPAVTIVGPCTLRRPTIGSFVSVLNTISFKLRSISKTSSLTPGIVENSWLTPAILTATIADPSKSDNNVRLRAFPNVVPCPFSNGPMINLL